MTLSLISLSKHVWTHRLLMSRFKSHTSASQKINHRLRLMPPIMASCDCPFIIPLIIAIIIIIISLLQFITLCLKEDSIMFWKGVVVFFFFVLLLFVFSNFAANGNVHKPRLQLHLHQCVCQSHVKVRIHWGQNELETGLDRQRSIEFGR